MVSPHSPQKIGALCEAKIRDSTRERSTRNLSPPLPFGAALQHLNRMLRPVTTLLRLLLRVDTQKSPVKPGLLRRYAKMVVMQRCRFGDRVGAAFRVFSLQLARGRSNTNAGEICERSSDFRIRRALHEGIGSSPKGERPSWHNCRAVHCAFVQAGLLPWGDSRPRRSRRAFRPLAKAA